MVVDTYAKYGKPMSNQKWGISLAHSVECWILNLEAPGSILAWGELFISTFPLFPVTLGHYHYVFSLIYAQE